MNDDSCYRTIIGKHVYNPKRYNIAEDTVTTAPCRDHDDTKTCCWCVRKNGLEVTKRKLHYHEEYRCLCGKETPDKKATKSALAETTKLRKWQLAESRERGWHD